MWLLREITKPEFMDADPQTGDYIFNDSIQVLLNVLHPLYHIVTFTGFSANDNTLIIIYGEIGVRFGPDFIVLVWSERSESIPYSDVDPQELFEKVSNECGFTNGY